MTSGSVLDLINLYQPSVMKLARDGNPQAIALWINTHLVPQGIYTRVETESPGQFLIAVEFQREPERDRLVRFLCHRLHRLESSVIQQLRIVAQPVGSSTVSWEQTVRLLASSAPRAAAPLNPVVQLPPEVPTPVEALPKPRESWVRQVVDTVQDWFSVEGGRGVQLLPTHPSLWFARPLLMGSAIAFLIGCGFEAVSYHTDWLEYGIAAVRPFDADAPKVWVKSAFGSVPVRQMPTAGSSTNPVVKLVFSTDAVLEGDPSTPSEAELKPDDLAALREADLVLTGVNRPIADERTDDARLIPLDRLRAIGVDLVNVGIDEAGQVVGRNVSRTLKILRQVDIRPVGLGRSQREARRPEIFEVRGQRIAYLSYSDADIDLKRPSPGATLLERQIQEDIQAIRSEVQWVVITFRWGNELAEYPSDWQMQLARYAVDQGADLVVGQHPTVMQGAEVYNGRAIAYSLGDLIFADTETAQENYDSAVLSVSLQDDEMHLEFLPVQVRNREPKIVSNEAGEATLRYIQQASALFKEPLDAPLTIRGRTVERPMDLTDESPTPLPTASTAEDRGLSAEDDLENSSSTDSFISYPDDAPAAEDESSFVDEEYAPEENGELYEPSDEAFTTDESFVSE